MLKDILLFIIIACLGVKACSLEQDLSLEFDCARFSSMCNEGE